MENKERIRRTVGSTKGKLKHRAPGKDDTLKRLPLRQLQIHSLSHNLLAGEKKPRGQDITQVSKATGRVDASCQTDSSPPAVGSDDWKMCTKEKPSEKYWEMLAEKRRSALAEALQENMELHKEVEELKEAVKALENKNSDAEYFAMMYSMTRSTTSTTD